MRFFILFFQIHYLLIAQKSSSQVSIRLLQTTDIHSYYLHTSKDTSKGGWLRLASLIDKLRAENKNNLLIDCGDSIQGSALGSLEKGKIAVHILNSLKYDAWILGNHELDFGLSHLDKLLAQIKIPVINGNFSFRSRQFPAWKIYHKDGVKIALIGLQVAYLKHWFVGKDYQDFHIIKGYDTVKKSLQQLRSQNVDVIILAAHQGCGNDWRGVNEIDKICNDFPEIDIVLGGHTHQHIVAKKINQSYYMQAGFHASHLGVLDFIYDKELKKIISMHSSLYKADKNIVYEPKITKRLKETLAKLQKQVNQTLFSLPKKISVKKMQKITSLAITQKTNSQFCLQRKIVSGLPKGKINLDQLFRLYPYENRLFTLAVSYRDLKSIFAEQNTLFRRQQELYYKGKLLKKIPFFKGKKTLAINSYTAAGAGRYPTLVKIIQKNRQTLKEFAFIIRNIVKEYLQKNTN